MNQAARRAGRDGEWLPDRPDREAAGRRSAPAALVPRPPRTWPGRAPSPGSSGAGRAGGGEGRPRPGPRGWGGDVARAAPLRAASPGRRPPPNAPSPAPGPGPRGRAPGRGEVAGAACAGVDASALARRRPGTSRVGRGPGPRGQPARAVLAGSRPRGLVGAWGGSWAWPGPLPEGATAPGSLDRGWPGGRRAVWCPA